MVRNFTNVFVSGQGAVSLINYFPTWIVKLFSRKVRTADTQRSLIKVFNLALAGYRRYTISSCASKDEIRMRDDINNDPSINRMALTTKGLTKKFNY